jgi:Haem-binding domain
MMKAQLYRFVLLTAGLLVFDKVYANSTFIEPSSIWYPKVAPILQQSCSKCHVAKENGRKGKAARKFDLTNYLAGKQLSLPEPQRVMLEQVIQTAAMPPRTYLWRHPERKVSAGDKAVILNWIKAEKAQ